MRKNLTIVMQEPLLFNESIKENILYGDQSASDKKIREVSIQTNSLPFIMQTEDDFSSDAVRIKLKELLREVAEAHLKNHRGIQTSINAMLRSESEKDYKTLFFMLQVLPNLSEFGLGQFESKF
jgi:ABC-type multidrug transport system fused ATPase/permease subunit